MNKNKGFTLIELLVVIAIIGILSSVVLASLSGARTKAKIAAVQSTLSSMRAQAEIGVVNGYYVKDLCFEKGQGGLGSLLASLNNTTSKITDLKCGFDSASSETPRHWAVEVKIADKWYCTDSSGYSGLSKLTGQADGLSSTTDGATIGSTTNGTYSGSLISGVGANKSSLICSN